MRFNIAFYLAVGLVGVLLLDVTALVAQETHRTEFEVKKDSLVKFSGEAVGRIYNPGGRLRGNLALSPNLKYFVGRTDASTICIFDFNENVRRKISISHEAIYGWFSLDSSKIALSAEYGKRSRVTVLDLGQGRVISVIVSARKFNQFSFSPDGKRVATSTDEARLLSKEKNFVKLWDATDGKLIAIIEGCGKYNKSPVFSPDSRFLVLGCGKLKNKPTKVIDTKTGLEISSFWKNEKIGSYEYTSAFTPESVFSPDSKNVVSIVGFTGVTLWDAVTGKLKKNFVASKGSINEVTFSPDGKIFATSGFSPVIRLWNADTGELIRAFRTEITKSPFFFIGAMISSDNKALIGIDNRGRVTTWDILTGSVRFTFNKIAEKQDLSFRSFLGLGNRVLYIRNEESISVLNAQTGSTIFEVPNPTGLYFFGNSGKTFLVQGAGGISAFSIE